MDAALAALVTGLFAVLLWWLNRNLGSKNGKGSTNQMLGTLVDHALKQDQYRKDQMVINAMIIRSLNRLNRHHSQPEMDEDEVLRAS